MTFAPNRRNMQPLFFTEIAMGGKSTAYRPQNVRSGSEPDDSVEDPELPYDNDWEMNDSDPLTSDPLTDGLVETSQIPEIGDLSTQVPEMKPEGEKSEDAATDLEFSEGHIFTPADIRNLSLHPARKSTSLNCSGTRCNPNVSNETVIDIDGSALRVKASN